ncbi:MAG: FMN-binding protein [Thiobacillaceae bacterium]
MALRSSLSLIVLLAACSGNAFADTVYQTREDFLREVFGTPPQAQVLWLDNGVQDKLKALLGHPYGQARLRYWRAGGKTAWILDEIGKEYPITAAFVVKNAAIERARVLVYREARGMEVRYPSFLQQFVGSSLSDGKLSRTIDGISGATLSVHSMERMAQAALALDTLAK